MLYEQKTLSQVHYVLLALKVCMCGKYKLQKQIRLSEVTYSYEYECKMYNFIYYPVSKSAFWQVFSSLFIFCKSGPLLQNSFLSVLSPRLNKIPIITSPGKEVCNFLTNKKFCCFAANSIWNSCTM